MQRQAISGLILGLLFLSSLGVSVPSFSIASGTLTTNQVRGLDFDNLSNIQEWAGNNEFADIRDWSTFFGPIVGNASQEPIIVDYTTPVTVTCHVLPNISEIVSVILNYRVDNSTWTPRSMTNSTLIKYDTTIPVQPWPSFVEYYINATDIGGFSTLLVNGSTYYNYIIRDDIDPEIAITWPEGETYISGIVEVEITASDEGSGIQYVELYIGQYPNDMVRVVNLSNPPYTYTWITGFHPNGLCILQAVTYDRAQNYQDDIQGNIIVNVQNRPIDPWPLITLFVVGSTILIIVAVFIVYWIHRRRCAQPIF
jgi:hypothetical protein